MSKPVVWFVDENQAQLRTYTTALQECLSDSVEVRGIVPYPHVEDYIEPIINDPVTVSVVIDQRLKDTGIADYEGMELAKFLRGINPKLPIYILTNYADDDVFAGGEWSIEYVIPKSDFRRVDKRQTIGARILRHVDVYTDILDRRELRFHHLLEKSLTTDLTAEELSELKSIESFRTTGVIASEIRQLEALEDIVSRHKAVLDSVKKMRKEKK